MRAYGVTRLLVGAALLPAHLTSSALAQDKMNEEIPSNFQQVRST